MKLPNALARILAIAVLALAITASPAPTSSQNAPASEPSSLHLSSPSPVASFPAAIWFDARSPVWANGYFARLTLGDFPAGLEVYDKNGKLVSQTYVSIPGATQLWLVGVSPDGKGGAIASGTLSSDEETTDFLAATSTSGGVVSTVHTQNFLAAKTCKAADGTIWAIGRDTTKESEHDLDYEIVRQYSFEKGLLRGYIPRSSVNFQVEGVIGAGEGESSAFLACGKDRISVFLNETKEYFEIDPAKETLKRWKMPMAPLDGSRVTSLAVTDTGRVFASLFELREEGDTKTHGLFELQAEPNSPQGKWTLVNGTLNTQPRLDDAPKGSFFRLWGADGDSLVIRRLFDADMQWVRVIP